MPVLSWPLCPIWYSSHCVDSNAVRVVVDSMLFNGQHIFSNRCLGSHVDEGCSKVQ